MTSKVSPNSRRSSLAAKMVLASSVASALLLAIPAAHAATVLYEPFNYGLAQGTTMTGVTANAVGLDGTYNDVDKNLPLVNGALQQVNDATFNTNSLPFNGVMEEGGSVTINPGLSPSGGGKPIFYAPINTAALGAAFGSTSPITLYGSFLLSVSENSAVGSTGGSGFVSALQFGTTTTNSTGGVTAITADNSSPINISPISWGQSNGQIRVDGVGAYGTGTQLSPNTPYIELFQFTITGGLKGTVTANDWTLSESQYANFRGNLTAAALNAASTGTAADNVTEEAAATGTGDGSLAYINNMTLMSFGTTSTFDEIHVSTTSLADASPVPEPAALGLAGVGALGLLLLKRRRNIA